MLFHWNFDTDLLAADADVLHTVKHEPYPSGDPASLDDLSGWNSDFTTATHFRIVIVSERFRRMDVYERNGFVVQALLDGSKRVRAASARCCCRCRCHQRDRPAQRQRPLGDRPAPPRVPHVVARPVQRPGGSGAVPSTAPIHIL